MHALAETTAVEAAAGREPLLDVADLTKDFPVRAGGLLGGKARLRAVAGVSFTLAPGETLGIVGESGCGKSTLGRLVLRLLAPTSGKIHFDGRDISALSEPEMRPLRRDLQVVFQDPFSSLNPRLSVKQIIEEGLIVNGIGGNSAARDKRVRGALVDVGLDPNTLNRFPHEFSGGQRQRIAIARALVLDPEFILLDEPTSALDLSVQGQVIDLLRDLQRRHGLSYLFISHDLKVVRALCHRVIVMRGGKVVEAGDTDQIMDSPQEDYTKRLVRAALEVEA